MEYYGKNYFDNSNNEKNFNIIFISTDNQINNQIFCSINDSLAKLEEKIYNQYPIFKDYNTYLTFDGKLLKRFKTIKENKIQNGSIIIVNYINE